MAKLRRDQKGKMQVSEFLKALEYKDEFINDLLNQIKNLASEKSIDSLKVLRALEERMPDIFSLDLSPKWRFCFYRTGIKKLTDLLTLDNLDIFMNEKGIGAAAITELLDKMREYGCTEWANKMELRLADYSGKKKLA